jgi:hypothetical protein
LLISQNSLFNLFMLTSYESPNILHSKDYLKNDSAVVLLKKPLLYLVLPFSVVQLMIVQIYIQNISEKQNRFNNKLSFTIVIMCANRNDTNKWNSLTWDNYVCTLVHIQFIHVNTFAGPRQPTIRNVKLICNTFPS